MAPPRVAIVTPGSFPVPSPLSGSVERVVEEIAPRAASSGVDVTVYGRQGRGQSVRETRQGVRYERYRLHSGHDRRYIRMVSRALRKNPPEVVQVENRPLFALRLKRDDPRRRVWLALHSTTFIGNRHLTAKSLRSSLRAVERIVVNSRYLRDVVSAKVPEAVSKLQVVQLGVDTSRFPSRYGDAGSEIRRTLREAKKWRHRTIVLFMGRLIPKKGVHHLLRVVPRIVEAHPDALFLIVGSPFYGSNRDTAYSRKLKRSAAPYASHVRFIPYVPYSEVPRWFLAADIAVVPSGSDEAFGLVNVEAMATGLPVVATGAGGIREIVEDGVTGFLVPPDDVAGGMQERLMLLIGDAKLRKRMGREGRRAVEKQFTWQKTAERWIKLLGKDD